MTPYRKREAKASDLENDALDDLLLRIKGIRRHVALPVVVVSLVAAWLGAAAHLFGYWPLLGSRADGSYYVSFASAALAAVLCGLPVLAPGIGIYLALRARLRRAWLNRHVAKGASEEWLGESVQRFG